mmetsp:Transcript_32841/g.101527  ORF Transcript_32841/g.101527 Transcript_32841/m.101527 type:complete len:248 (+) Transcript_32841:226-969(+)
MRIRAPRLRPAAATTPRAVRPATRPILPSSLRTRFPRDRRSSCRRRRRGSRYRRSMPGVRQAPGARGRCRAPSRAATSPSRVRKTTGTSRPAASRRAASPWPPKPPSASNSSCSSATPCTTTTTTPRRRNRLPHRIKRVGHPWRRPGNTRHLAKQSSRSPRKLAPPATTSRRKIRRAPRLQGPKMRSPEPRTARARRPAPIAHRRSLCRPTTPSPSRFRGRFHRYARFTPRSSITSRRQRASPCTRR